MPLGCYENDARNNGLLSWLSLLFHRDFALTIGKRVNNSVKLAVSLILKCFKEIQIV